MNNFALEDAIANALEREGENKEANKAYLEFIKANFVIPVEKNHDENEPQVLYLHEGVDVFLPAFSNEDDLKQWASEIQDQIQLLYLSGVDLLKGIGDGVTVCLNIGNTNYKEFNPAEIARMKGMVLKFFS